MSRLGEGQVLYHSPPSPSWRDDGAPASTASSGFISTSPSTSRTSPVSSSNPQRQQAGSDPRPLQRKPAPSPLQTCEISTSPESSPAQSSFGGTRRRSSPRREPANQSSLPSTGYPNPSGSSQAPEKRAPLADPKLRATANASPSVPHNDVPPAGATPSRSVNYASLRQLSNPLPSSRPTTSSTHSSPTMSPTGPKSPEESKPLPRTSSIDSAISSLSSHSHKQSQDSVSFKPADIANLIATAGSAEAVIQHLLKEKQSSASQNSQLWRLVDKQRTMILGLNKDLEQALKDKDRYRRKVKEHLAEPSRLPNHAPVKDRPKDTSESQNASPEPTQQQQNLAPSQPSNVRDIVSGKLRESTASAFEVQDLSHTASSPPAHPESAIDAQIQSPGNHNESRGPARSAPQTPAREPGNGNEVTSPMSLSQSPSPRQQTMPRGSFTAKRSMPSIQRNVGTPSIESIQSKSPGEHNEKIPHPQRKAPPAPLNLSNTSRASPYSQQAGPEDHSESDYDDVDEVDELPAFERGRRKTREDDDRDREAAAAALLEREHRSRSKREKATKSAKTGPQASVDGEEVVSKPQAKHKANASDGFDAQMERGPYALPSSMLSPPRAGAPAQLDRRFVSLPPMSPGLPNSPRPADRPLNSPMPRMPREGSNLSSLVSPPMSPRQGFPGLPLTPRAPRQPIPMPPNTAMSLASPGLYRDEGSWRQPPSSLSRQVKPSLALDSSVINPISDRSTPRSASSQVIYRGLVSEKYPELLVPPEALVAIDVRAASSRLRPSRHSYLGVKPSDEDQVFTLGVYSVPGGMELWRVEKTFASLVQLDKQLKKMSDVRALVPDKSLFNGHAPARIDARRSALDAYFHAILRTALDEPASILLCTFLSTDTIERHGEETTVTGETAADGPLSPLSPVRSLKEGYLTKKGKNFGGWKARFFCLEGPVLRYYETPGGAHLGTIKLHHAQIGKQSQQHPNPLPPVGNEDTEGEYRHAFLILEPKRKDSSSYVRHVLCAESDAERDEWVHTLLQYVDPSNTGLQQDSGSARALDSKTTLVSKEGQSGKESPNPENTHTLRSLHYEDTVAAEAPVRGPSAAGSEDLPSTPSPTSSTSQSGAAHSSSMHISRPTNGTVIQDVGAWGNLPAASLAAKEKEYKKRSIWGFKGRSSSELGSQTTLANSVSGGSLTQQNGQDRSTPVRAVFGIPLAEAAESCRPHNVNVKLPAVVYRCLEYLEAEGATNEEGIFRVNGSNVVIKALRERFNTEGDVNFLAEEQYYDIHAVASLLKLYLRELPATVLTRELHLDFLHVLELDDKEQKVAAYNALVHRLPDANWNLLKALSTFLLGIINNSDVNKMTVRNVGIVFSPTLNIPAPVFSMFLTEFDRIFGEEVDQTASPVIEISHSPPLTPEDIRSPRRQMFSDLSTPSYNQTAFPVPVHDRFYEPQQQYQHQQHQGQDPRGVYDTGFVPMKPSYDQSPYQQSPSFSQAPGGPQPLSGTEFGSLNEALAAPTNMRDTKARRRESTMLMMGLGQRKGSLPSLTEDSPLI